MAIYQPTYTDPKTGNCKTSAYWWVDFTIGNKRIRRSTETTRKTIALNYEKTAWLELERALAGLPTSAPEKRIRTIEEIVKAYLDHYGLNHRSSSALIAKQRLAHVRRLIGTVLLPDLTEDRIRQYIKGRLGESTASPSGRTINMELGELSRALGHKWSELWPRVRKLEENHDAGQALSRDDETRLLSVAASDGSPNRNPMLYPFLCIALSTGMRAGEIRGLRWDSLDTAAAVLTVGRAKTKRGTGRQIPINADLAAVLEDHRLWCVRKLGAIAPTNYMFPGRGGRPLKGEKRPLNPLVPIRDITTAWDALRATTGIQCRLHDLRHTAATKMAEAGVPESAMLAIMGHMSRAMLERYSHIRMAAKREAVKSLELPQLGPRLVALSKASRGGVCCGAHRLNEKR